MIDYIRDGQEIYRNSFAIIRAEANLDSIPADLEKLAVRVIHTCVSRRVQARPGAMRWPLARRFCAMRAWCLKGSHAPVCLPTTR